MNANFTQTLRYFSEALLLIGTVSTAGPGGLNHLYDVTIFGLNTLQQVLLRSLQLYVLVSITPLICWLPVVFPLPFPSARSEAHYANCKESTLLALHTQR